eukprot:scaffold22638_cov138-Cylindrotheca_fusiformis.AAC.17
MVLSRMYQEKRLRCILQLGSILLLIGCTVVESGRPRRRTRSRSHRGMIGSLGALNHGGKASDGWEKIKPYLDGVTSSPTQDPDRTGTEFPIGGDGDIDVDTTAPSAPSMVPTVSPTKAPAVASTAPTKTSPYPTTSPTTKKDSDGIIDGETSAPSAPSMMPTILPTKAPTVASAAPTNTPFSPTKSPTKNPDSVAPSHSPTKDETSMAPSSQSPTKIQTSIAPTRSPSSSQLPTAIVETDQSQYPSPSPSTLPVPIQSTMPSNELSFFPSGIPSDGPSTAPSKLAEKTQITISDTAVLCPEASTSIVSKTEVSWTYAVHFKDSTDTTAAMRILEQVIGSELEDDLLYCRTSGETRRLDSQSTAGLDYLPLDEPQPEVCPGGPDNCVVFKGYMMLYLATENDLDDAVLVARRSIKTLMNAKSHSFIDDGITSIEYLGPDFGTAAVQEDRSKGNRLANEDAISPPTIVMASLAAVCVTIALAAGYRYKKRGEDAAGTSTIGPVSSHHSMASSKNSICSTGSQTFSVPMPSSYRLGESHCMDVILEGGGSDTSSQTHDGELIVSDCGYSSDASSRDTASLQYSNDHMLGAFGMYDLEGRDDLDSYLYSESNSEDIPSPYDSDYDDSGFLEFREQGLRRGRRNTDGTHQNGGHALSPSIGLYELS